MYYGSDDKYVRFYPLLHKVTKRKYTIINIMHNCKYTYSTFGLTIVFYQFTTSYELQLCFNLFVFSF